MEEKTIYNYKITLTILLCVILTANAASAGIIVSVIPDSLNVQPGDNTVYQIKIQSISSETEHAVLSIRDPIPGWTYVFDDPEFDITPGSIITTNLHVTASGSASEKLYYSNVSISSSVSNFKEFTGETSFFSFGAVINTIPPAPIPDVPTIISVGVGISCLLFLLRRKRKTEGVV